MLLAICFNLGKPKICHLAMGFKRAFADDNRNENQIILSIFGKDENIVRKRENACKHHFLLFVPYF